jgi:hypothetical protein
MSGDPCPADSKLWYSVRNGAFCICAPTPFPASGPLLAVTELSCDTLG